MRIAIIGGGIGGLAASLFLQRALPSAEIVIFEQARALGDVGAGIQLSPNATRLLGRVGVMDDLLSVAVKPQRSHQRRWRDGTVIASSPMGDLIEQRFGAPYLHLHRADLITVLADHVNRNLGESSVRLGSHVSSVSDDGRAVVCIGQEPEPFDVIVGADGIHSVTRTHVLGVTPEARYSGHVAYRAVIPNVDPSTSGPILSEPEVNVWLGPGGHVVQYLLRRGELINLVIVVESTEAVPESWNEVGDPDVLRATFADWDPALRSLLARVETTMRWALHDHQPLHSWVRGPVCLLGDSAHPMLPYLAQGGAQSIEDGAALASSLSHLDGSGQPAHVNDALRAYQDRRIERTSTIQLNARQVGEANHLPDGEAQRLRDERLAEGPVRRAPGGLDLYGHDAEDASTVEKPERSQHT
jgi:salicylate hydroxylase